MTQHQILTGEIPVYRDEYGEPIDENLTIDEEINMLFEDHVIERYSKDDE